MSAADMPAGRELDALVAEKVMGLELARYDEDGFPPMLVIDGLTDFATDYEIPAYSTDIAAAWEVVERLRSQGFQVSIWSPGEVTDGRSYIQFDRWEVVAQRGAIEAAPIYDAEGEGEAETAPLAVCRAALAAVEAP